MMFMLIDWWERYEREEIVKYLSREGYLWKFSLEGVFIKYLYREGYLKKFSLERVFIKYLPRERVNCKISP